MQNKLSIDTPADYQPLGVEEWYLHPRNTEAPDLTEQVHMHGHLLAKYLADSLDLTSSEEAALDATIGERLTGVRVYTSRLNTSENKVEGGQFEGNERVIIVNEDQDENRAQESFGHEIVHAAALSATVWPTVLKSDARNALNGLQSHHYNFRVSKSDPGRRVYDGRWINEAMVEHVRRKAFGVHTSEAEGGYQLEVILLRALFDVDPGLERQMIESMFIKPTKSKSWGGIEKIVGPLWIEETEVALSRDLTNFPFEIIDAIPDEKIQQSLVASILRQAREQGLHR